jgi:hypothetical protein
MSSGDGGGGGGISIGASKGASIIPAAAAIASINSDLFIIDSFKIDYT